MKVKNLLAMNCIVLIAGSAVAQVPATYVKKGIYEGTSPNAPHCPAIRYIFRELSPEPVGYVWFTDASGMSKATGTLDMSSGHFDLKLTSLDGNGPTGEATGTRDPYTGVVTAQLDGPGCSKLTLGPTNPYVRKADGTD